MSCFSIVCQFLLWAVHKDSLEFLEEGLCGEVLSIWFLSCSRQHENDNNLENIGTVTKWILVNYSTTAKISIQKQCVNFSLRSLEAVCLPHLALSHNSPVLFCSHWCLLLIKYKTVLWDGCKDMSILKCLLTIKSH